jgi:hypothetical protein
VPASGSLFAVTPVGTSTTVTCTAIDHAGNTATASFRVHVAGAPELLDDLLALVRELDANKRSEQKLAHRVEAVKRQLAAGRDRPACIDVRFLVDQVANHLRRGWLTPADAARLTHDAEIAAPAMGC